MDSNIWAVWYNLDPTNRKTHLDWLHGTYLPKMVGMPGIAWAANYQVDEDQYKERRGELVHTSDDIPQATQFICLICSSSAHLFFHDDSPVMEENLSEDAQNHLAERRESRFALLIEEHAINGPSYGTSIPSAGPTPSIQLGSFRMSTPEHDVSIGQWYVRYRMPDIAMTPGIVRMRKFVATVGWCRHAVLYEFESDDIRQTHGIRDRTKWSRSIVDETVHAPGSPLIGKRLWPLVE